MRAENDIHRALARTTLELHEQMEVRRGNVHHDHLREREQQFQAEFTATLGPTPAEKKYTVLFDIVFLGDYGSLRDSQLGEPIFRHGFTMLNAPAGTVPYAHVSQWITDDGLNFIGAEITVGFFNLKYHNGKAVAPPSTRFKGTVHLAFQMMGTHVEEDSMT